MNRALILLTASVALTATRAAHPQDTDRSSQLPGGRRPALVVTLENRAPLGGTFQTPVWVGLHDGSFDTYDGGLAANALPLLGSDALERLAEDGSTGPLSADFASLQPDGADGTVLSNDPNLPPLAPGAVVSRLFELNPRTANYFSYVSMVIPSNDAFVANGSATAHPILDAAGRFVAADFSVAGRSVNDAGTELNDESPTNTAFFGQAAPNTGVTTADVVGAHPGFLSPGSGGILDDPMFANADFLAPGYETLGFKFQLIDRAGRFRSLATLDGSQEVPAVSTEAAGFGRARVNGARDRIGVLIVVRNLSSSVTGAHVHVGSAGSNGPVVADLTAGIRSRGSAVVIALVLDGTELAGPFAGEADPLGAFLAELVTGGLYFNVHTDDHPSGEVRGQLL